ncbi:biotin and thiamin synthesis associated protein [Thermincola ferriacetica]|uniref:Biotin and thiamin synthesis associated protein n=1 Tax=Thermincola ferriacetica TaxID=281456 RepID=A0A0L6W2K6_9FIRM|nr:[FeFe] hydrogenase H-cluster radical SAM maturase HydG [Thermincola ferriacetica]KNZ69701.1 biotin and thiamin synthesis associated protein [Thermincola ferriacetica]
MFHVKHAVNNFLTEVVNNMTDYISEEQIAMYLEHRKPDKKHYADVLSKAAEGKGLLIEETAVLLSPPDEETKHLLFNTAGKVKQQIYGTRIVLFAPLYLSNYCGNNCLYCGFRKDNKIIKRRKLNKEEALEEVKLLEKQGHKRLLLVTGEASGSGVEYLADLIGDIYALTDIRRVNINVAPLTVDEFRMVKEAGIGTYQLFQETYHQPSYKYYHPSGKKSDYQWRISAFDRAMEAGIDDIGMGVLFGLYNYKFEVLALCQHAEYLERKFGVGPHTVSVPRLKRAPGAEIQTTPWMVDDEELKIIVAVLRLALPYTGIILSTRESQQLRNELLGLGVSQISAGSSTSPGGYSSSGDNNVQFEVHDTRSLDEVVASLCKDGYIPSFCTACYRRHRTGEAFMSLAKVGDIKELCLPNALLTFKENLLDYASQETKKLGENLIGKELCLLKNEALVNELKSRFERMNRGERDLYF